MGAPAIRRQVDSRIRARKALELRQSGMTYQRIADTLGFRSAQSAKEAFERALKETGLGHEDARQMLLLELSRLEQLGEKVWPEALAGEHDSIALWLKISERRTRLAGIDSLKVEVESSHTSHTTVTHEVSHDASQLLDVVSRIAGRIADSRNEGGDRDNRASLAVVAEHPLLPSRSQEQ